jgi:hypothetical protein
MCFPQTPNLQSAGQGGWVLKKYLEGVLSTNAAVMGAITAAGAEVNDMALHRKGPADSCSSHMPAISEGTDRRGEILPRLQRSFRHLC